MIDEQETHGETSQSHDEQSATVVPAETQVQTNQQQNRTRYVVYRSKPSSWRIVLSEVFSHEKVFTLLLGFFGLLIGAWSLKILSRQIDVMNTQSGLMTKQTEIMDRQNQLLDLSREEAKAASGDAAKQARIYFDATMQQSKAGLSASTAQSKAALDANSNALQVDQRPWISVGQFSLSAAIEQGKEITVDYSMRNTGKTPAINVTVQNRIIVSPTEPPVFAFPLPRELGSSVTLLPGELPTGRSSKFTLADPVIERYQQASVRFYVQMVIRYEDAFGKRHWTTYCVSHTYGNPLNNFQFCTHGNDVDRTE